MKRDFELIRKLLFFFEEKEDPAHVEMPPIAGYSDIEIKYHCNLLYDAGFLWCEPTVSTTSERIIKVLPFDLTWNGHEFLEKIRSDNIWKQMKTFSKEKGLTLSFNVVNELAKKFIINTVINS